MAATRHRWSDNGKCNRCKLKMKMVKVPDPRPGRKGKLTQPHYQVDGNWQRDMPACPGTA